MESNSNEISHFLNSSLIAELMSMGYSKNVAEKSLLMTGNKTAEAAIDWAEQNRSLPDFEEPYMLVPKPEGTPSDPTSQNPIQEQKPKRTPEEIKQAAKELQEKIRKNRELKEKTEMETKEKDRVKSAKELVVAKQKYEEEKIKRELELKQKEKMDDAIKKKKMLEQLERDRIERFGVSKASAKPKSPTSSKHSEPEAAIKLDVAKTYVKKIIEMYDERNLPGKSSGCLTYACKYMENLMKDPSNEKFVKINTENKVFKENIGALFNGINLFISMGFKLDPVSKMLVFSAKYSQSDFEEFVKYMKETVNVITSN